MREFRTATAGEPQLTHTQLRYGPHRDHVAEVLLPAGPTALVVVIHGGFWRAAYDRGHTAAQCVGLAKRGWAVASIEYRRVGDGGGWPHTFTDVAAALDSVPTILSADVGEVPVVLMGHSAGGHLALWAAGRHRLPPDAPGHREQPSPLAGTVALGAVADLAWAHRHRAGTGADVDLLGTTPDNDPEGRWAAADPARLLPTGIPTVLVHGQHDDAVPVGCANAYVAAAQAAGDPCRMRYLPGVGHFEFLDPRTAAWAAAADATADLLR